MLRLSHNADITAVVGDLSRRHATLFTELFKEDGRYRTVVYIVHVLDPRDGDIKGCFCVPPGWCIFCVRFREGFGAGVISYIGGLYSTLSLVYNVCISQSDVHTSVLLRYLIPAFFLLFLSGLVKIEFKLTTLPRSKLVSCVYLIYSSWCNIRTRCCYPCRVGTLIRPGPREGQVRCR